MRIEMNENNIKLFDKFNSINELSKESIIEYWAKSQIYGYVQKRKDSGKITLIYGEGKSPKSTKVHFFRRYECLQNTIRFSEKKEILKHYDLNEYELSLIKQDLFFDLKDDIIIKEVGQRIKDWHELAY